MELKEYLIHKFGKRQGQFIITNMLAECSLLEKMCVGENAANSKTMQIKIFPRVALYRVMQKIMSKEQAYEIVWEYTKNCICEQTRRQYLKMEKVPFFFLIFRKMFLHIMRHSSQWDTEVTQNAKNKFAFAVHRCLWNDTCQKCGCPELCRVFCDSDWENYGALHKVRFCRTQTLGTGGNLCDFTFYKQSEIREKE
ncbi:MAG: L-2-amino-thiazoline-4-carboxylic acid hydrolase [Lachnospiraceae bacterium]|nr:L-2-amino-thiazoline-4-carboxylic acid hydrolase [Lachnospiraceae bacterium]